MRYSASEKFEIIELVEQSSLSIPRTLAPIGIPRSTFYDWYSRYQEGGIEALEDGKPRPRRIWNKISDKIETAIVNLALEEPDLSPRELAVNFTDTKGSFVSEATVYRLLKDHGLITSPAFILMKAADRFANPTTAPNQLWQTDFTYLKVIGWGWFYLSTVLDDFSRYILAWKLCTTMSATDVSDTLQVALQGSGLNQVKVLHRPRLLSDNGPSYVSSELGEWLDDNGIRHIRGRPYHPMTQGKIERYHRSMKNRILLENYYLPGQLEQSIEEFVEYYNNGVIDPQTAKGNATRLAIVHPAAAAAVARDIVLRARIAKRQLAPAAAAAEKARQQSVAVLGRAVMAAGGYVTANHLADRLGLLPADISLMGVRHQRQPIAARLAMNL